MELSENVRPALFGIENDFYDSDDEIEQVSYQVSPPSTPKRVLTPLNAAFNESPPHKSNFLTLLAKHRMERPDVPSDDEGSEPDLEKVPAVPYALLGAKFVDFIGRQIDEDEFGEWRTVPDLEGKIQVSSKGYVRRVDAGRVQPAVLPKPGTLGYRCIGVGGKMHKVSRLVCTAFHGPCPPAFTCLHISKGVDMISARADDRAENLRWASRADLVNCRRKCKRQRTGKPIMVRHISWDDTTPSLRFATATEADDVLKVKGLRHAANPAKTVLVNRVWRASWVEPDECQEDLPATDTEPAEVWVDVMETLRVSNRGRAQALQNQHRWGRIFVPKCSEGEQYPTVGRHQYFHHVLWRAFGNVVPDGYIIDHLDGERENNKLSNLRAMSWVEHNAGLGRKRKRFLV